MKKNWFIILFIIQVLVFSNISFWNSINWNSIFSLIKIIENNINIEEANITSNINYNSINEILEGNCNNNYINEAKKLLPNLKQAWNSWLNKDREKVLTKRFNILKDIVLTTNQNDEKTFCKNKYILYSMLETTQNLYEWKSPTIAENFNNGIKLSKNIINGNIKTNNTYRDFTFIHNTDWLSSDIKEDIKNQTERYLQETITDMLNRHLLNWTDIKNLNNKISVKYINSCENTEWAFYAKKDTSTEIITFKWIELVISYCSSNDTQQRNKRHVKQILAHELWHYIYYFKDKNPSSFSEICWENWEINCLPNEFVSYYARKSLEEDYAESFAYWYLNTSENDHSSAPLDEPINRRERHFERLFEELEREDDDDDDGNDGNNIQ